MSEADLKKLEKLLKYTFKSKELLTQAFVHSSFAKQHHVADNERMEFFGDALLETISSEYLFHKYPKKDAGELSKARAWVVSAEGLKRVVDSMKILDFLQLADGSESVKKKSSKIKSNVFEAVLCAVYLDGGFAVAKKFALRWLKPYLDNADSFHQNDYKSRLQEYCQHRKIAIDYKELDKSGPDNQPTFCYGVLLNNKLVGKGHGKNIKLAQANAAKIALQKLEKEQ